MNIVIINCFDTYEQRVNLVFNFFKKEGHSVSVLTSDYCHFKKCERTEKKEGYIFIPTHKYKKNFSISRLYSHLHFSKDVFHYAHNQFETIDLLWVLVPPNSLVKEVAKYKKEYPTTFVVIDLIDLWPETMPIHFFKHLPPFYFWKKMRNKYLCFADRIVTECNLFKKRMPKCINEEIVKTIYLARNPRPLDNNLDLPVDRISLCYLGSINNIIDIKTIGKIIKEIRAMIPVDLHIIGGGEKRDQLIALSKKAGANVVYHGVIYDSNEKQLIFNKCHFGLNIMKKTVYVGLTMKSIDYFEAGLPLINNIRGDTWDIIETEKLGINYKDKVPLNALLDFDRRKVRLYFENHFSVDCFQKSIKDVIAKKTL